MFEIDERRVPPEVTLHLVAGDDLSGSAQKETEDIERFALKPYGDSVLDGDSVLAEVA